LSALKHHPGELAALRKSADEQVGNELGAAIGDLNENIDRWLGEAIAFSGENALMSKRNHFPSPERSSVTATALKHDRGLHNAVVHRRRRKRPNAQKHGLYARPVIIPGEDPVNFTNSMPS
jgi:hypothetical protein